MAVLGFTSLVAGATAFVGQALKAGEASNLLKGRLEAVAGPFGETEQVLAAATRAADRFAIGQLEARESIVSLYSTMRPLGQTAAQIETTFIGVSKAVRLAGLSGLDAREAYRQLGQAIGAGTLQGDEFRSLMERIPVLGQKLVEVFNRIRSAGGLTLITRQQADSMVREVKDGEKRQTEAMREGSRRRKESLEESTDQELRIIARHYDRIKQIIEDQNSDRDNAEERARNNRLDAQREEIDARFQEQKKALDREYEDRRRRISDDESLSEERKTALVRDLQDEEQIQQEALQKRQDAETDALREQNDRASTIRRRQLRDQRQEREQALSDEQRLMEDAVRKRQEQAQRDEDAALEKSIQANKAASEKIIAGILARVEVTRGDLKKMASEGLINPQIVQMALDEMSKMKAPEPTALIKYNKAFSDLTSSLGEKLLPQLTPLIEKITNLIGDPAFQKSFSDLIANINEVVIPAIKPLLEVLSGILRAFAAIPPGIREAIVKMAVLVGLFRVLGGAAIVGGLLKIVGVLARIRSGAMGAGQAIKMVSVRDVTAGGLPGTTGPRMLPPAGGMPSMKPPPPNMFAGFLAELGKIGAALGGLLRQVASFGGLFLREIGLAIPGVARLGQALAGLRIGATIAGWLGAIGPFAGRAILLITPLLTWVTGTMVPALVAAFSGPVGWIALGVAALVAGLVLFREPIWNFVTWAVGEFARFWSTVGRLFYDQYLGPWVQLWNSDMLEPVRSGLAQWLVNIGLFWEEVAVSMTTWIQTTWSKLWSSDMLEKVKAGIASWMAAMKNFASGWKPYWESLKTTVVDVIGPITDFIDKIFKSLQNNVSSVVNAVKGAYEAVATKIVALWRWMTDSISGFFNGAIEKYNQLANLANIITGVRPQPVSPNASQGRLTRPELVPSPPRFADGGWITRPTLGWIGEGRDPGGEYAIPASQMGAAVDAWSRGARGEALIQASRAGKGSTGGTGGTGPTLQTPAVNLTFNAGPTLALPDGSQWVSTTDAERMIQASSEATFRAMVQTLRSANGRRALGLV
jgi:tape measure domain-containing protein